MRLSLSILKITQAGLPHYQVSDLYKYLHNHRTNDIKRIVKNLPALYPLPALGMRFLDKVLLVKEFPLSELGASKELKGLAYEGRES